jgi:hypothetical protein
VCTLRRRSRRHAAVDAAAASRAPPYETGRCSGGGPVTFMRLPVQAFYSRSISWSATWSRQRSMEWVRRQGGKDRTVGKACWTYTTFLIRYQLPKNPASLRLWAAYMPLDEQHLPTRGRCHIPGRTVPRTKTARVSMGPPLSAQREKELRNQAREPKLRPAA